MLPVKIGPAVAEEKSNVSVNQKPLRPFLLTDRPEKQNIMNDFE